MKKFLPALFLLIFFKGHSQLVLTKALYEPVIGDTSRTYLLDTAAYAGGLNAAATGTNHLWDYSQLVAVNSNTIVSAYLDPAAVPSSSNYPGCTVVQKQGPLNTYFKSVSTPSTQLEFMGITSSSLNMTFTNTAVYMRYPTALGNTVTDNFSGSFTFSISGTASGNVTVTADGSGTLALATTTLNDVLRVKTIQNTALNAVFITGTIKQTVYTYYHASKKFPILSISYQTVGITGQTPSVTAQASGDVNNFVVGINEYELPAFNSVIYPNPASESMYVLVDPAVEPKKLKIMNQLGQTVYSGNYSTTVNVSGLASGVYFIEVQADKGIARKRFVKD